MWVVAVWGSAAASGCPDGDRTTADLDTAIVRADEAVEALDPAGLDEATAALDAVLGCQAGAIRIEQAAHVHRIHGIRAFVTGSEDVDVWFAASRSLEPTAPLGHRIGGPIEAAWERALTVTPPQRSELLPPRNGALVVDGQLLQSRPTFLPYVFQHLDTGTALATALQPAGTEPPTYPGGSKPERTKKRGKPLSIAFVAATALSIGSLSGAAATRSRYNDPSRSDDEVEGLVPLNRTLGVAGYTLGGTAIALGSVAVAMEW